MSLTSLRVYTPASDYSFGAGERIQVIVGRDGNDTFIGYNPSSSISKIDIMYGDITPGDFGDNSGISTNWNNIFKLGDTKQPYYLDDNVFGSEGYAFIVDFDKEYDTIKLHGTPDNYDLITTDEGTGIFYLDNNQGRQDLIAFFLDSQDLELNQNYFEYEQEGSALPSNENVNQFGTESIDQSQSVATDSEGNVYLAGSTAGNLGGVSRGGSRDFWIGKYNEQGETIKFNQFGSSGLDQINEVVIGSQGDIYWSGFTTGNVAGRNQGESDVVVGKFNQNLNQLWVRQYGGKSIDISNDLTIDSEDNLYVVGVQVSEDLTQDDTKIVKFDANGREVWSSLIGKPESFDEGYNITIGPDGGVYVSGWTLGDLGGPNSGLYDIWYAKLNPENGELEWLKQFGSNDFDFSWGIDTDSNGNIYIAGWTLGNLGGPSAGSYDVWLRKTDPNGNEIFTKQFGGSGDDGVFKEALHIDQNDNIYLTGYTNDRLSGNPLGGFDGWVKKLNTSGGLIWEKQFGTNSGEYPYDLTTDPSGQSLYITGLTEGSFGTSNQGSTDAWTLKLNTGSGAVQSFNPTPNANTEELIDSEIVQDSSSLINRQPSPDILAAQLDALVTTTMREYMGLSQELSPSLINFPF